MAAEIYIARHGQNRDNADGVLNGHRDLPLTDLGRQQANELAVGLLESGIVFDSVFSSPLSRAHETAQIVCDIAAIKLGPIVLPELIERDFGIMTGQPSASIKEQCGPDILETDTITYFLNPEGAETFPQLIERGHKILDTVRERQTDGNALLVCHGDIGKMIYAAATGKDWRTVLADFHFGNCELIAVDPDNEAHVIKIEQHNH